MTLRFTDGNILWDSDLDTIVDGIEGSAGIYTGMEVLWISGLDIQVSIGRYVANSIIVEKISTTPLSVSAADLTYKRYDLVIGNSSGTISLVVGTPSAQPQVPNIPSGNIRLAVIEVPAAVLAISQALIKDCRIPLGAFKELEKNSTHDAEQDIALLELQAATSSPTQDWQFVLSDTFKLTSAGYKNTFISNTAEYDNTNKFWRIKRVLDSGTTYTSTYHGQVFIQNNIALPVFFGTVRDLGSAKKVVFLKSQVGHLAVGGAPQPTGQDDFWGSTTDSSPSATASYIISGFGGAVPGAAQNFWVSTTLDQDLILQTQNIAYLRYLKCRGSSQTSPFDGTNGTNVNAYSGELYVLDETNNKLVVGTLTTTTNISHILVVTKSDLVGDSSITFDASRDNGATWTTGLLTGKKVSLTSTSGNQLRIRFNLTAGTTGQPRFKAYSAIAYTA
jgi:hypothetical protein